MQPLHCEHSNKYGQSGFTLTEIAVVVAILGAVLAIAIPNLLAAHTTAQTKTCIANLKEIHAAKQQWATDNRKPAAAVPTTANLFGPVLYIRKLPLCPTGGTYYLRAISQRPQCSIAGHIM